MLEKVEMNTTDLEWMMAMYSLVMVLYRRVIGVSLLTIEQTLVHRHSDGVDLVHSIGVSLLTIEQTLVHRHSDGVDLVHSIGVSLLIIEQTLEFIAVLDGHILNNVVKDNHLNLVVGLEQVHDHRDMAVSISPNVETLNIMLDISRCFLTSISSSLHRLATILVLNYCN